MRSPSAIVSQARAVPGYVLKVLIFAMGVLLLFGSLQSDFSGADVSHVPVDGSIAEKPLNVTFKIDSFNEATNMAEVTIVAAATQPLAERIKEGKASFEFNVNDGLSVRSGSEHIATLTLDNTSFSEDLPGVESAAAMQKVVLFRGVGPYPFDTYSTYLSVNVTSPQVFPIPELKTTVVKLVAGRTIITKGADGNFSIYFKRPWLQQAFIVISGCIFTAIVIGIAWRIIQTPTAFSPVNQSVTLAGFLLGIAGFRDLMGFPKVAGVSISEAIVIGVPLMVLAYAFLRSSLLASALPKTVQGDISSPGGNSAL